MSKSIVVFYMHGGHDGYNMFVPLNKYDRYAHYRGEIAQPLDSLLPLHLGADNLAIHGSFQRTAEMIRTGMAAPILGTGNLHAPITNARYLDKSVKTPPFLFSHNHQQSYNKGATNQESGWAGRVLDAWYEGKAKPKPISPALTVATDLDLVSSETVGVSQIRNEGEIWQGLTADKLAAIYRLSQSSDYQHITERVAQGVMASAIDGQAYLYDLFGQYQASGKLNTEATVAAKLIAAADQLGHERQIIHVPIYGWDTHSDQFDYLNGKYVEVDNLFADFIEELENYGVADNVICITASDFGRSLVPNSRGTDHGWGNNQLVFGKPVRGNQIIGEFIDYDDPDYWTNAKRLIPKLSDNQSYATLAKWFGLHDAHINAIFPQLRKFDQPYLNFV